jgi:RNA polymerase sigma factor (sigma-70 family)
MTNVPPFIHVVDDDASFRLAIGDLLSACGYRVALYESAKRLLETPPSGEPACILLDVQMAGLNGPQLQDQLAELGCRLPIVFVTGHGDIPTSVRTIKAGAEDFLTKPVRKERLLEAIKRALVRYEEIREQDSRIAALRSLLSRLTPREREVFALLVRGNPHKQIAHALGTSERTVKMHRRNVMQKFEVQSLAELAVIAERLGLLPVSGRLGNEGLQHSEKKSTATTSGPPLTRYS